MNGLFSTRVFWKRTTALALTLGLLIGGYTGAARAQGALALSSVFTFPAKSYPTGLTAGPDGALWLTLGSGNAVGSLNLTPPAVWQPAALPAQNARPYDITIGPDGNLWFTELAGDQIGRLDRAGGLTEFPLETSGSDPAQIVLGQDGGLWFTEYNGNAIGRLAPDGTITEYQLPHPESQPLGLVSALDGSLWFTEWNGRRIGRINDRGEVLEYAAPNQASHPTEITLGPDGALWFIYEIGQNLVRVDPANGAMTSYNLSTDSTSFVDLVTGPDGKLWLLGTRTITRLTVPVSSPPVLETLAIPAIYESEGRAQIIAGPGAELYFITGNRQDVQRVGLPSADERDVQVFIQPYPREMLIAGVFEMDIEIINWSSSPANDLVVDIPLPENAHFLSADVPGLDCVEAAGHVLCDFKILAGGAQLKIPFFFYFERISTAETTRTFEVKVSMAEKDYLPANNRAYRGLIFKRSIDYFNDFTIGADDHWSHTRIASPDGALQYLGGFDNQNVTLLFSKLPHHDRAKICFDLYILGSWDGGHLVDPDESGDKPPVIGPDLWANYIDDTKLRVTTFSNQPRLYQSYPSEYNEGTFPSQSGSFAVGAYDSDASVTDSLYRMCVTRTHAQPELKYTFYGANLEGLSGEQWALDNVFVTLYYRSVYDWLFLPTLLR